VVKNYLTEAEAHAAADAIDASGKKPGTLNVYEFLQHGSYSTIQRHLLTWKPRDQMEHLPPMPEAIPTAVSRMAGDLWCVAVKSADERAAKAVAAAELSTKEAQTMAAGLGELADKLSADLAVSNEKIENLTNRIEERDQQIVQFQEYTQYQVTEIAKKDGEIETLRRTLAEFGDLMKTAKKRNGSRTKVATPGHDERAVQNS
jgi:hypothetical protein